MMAEKEQEMKDRAEEIDILQKKLGKIEQSVFDKSWKLDRLKEKWKDINNVVKRANEEYMVSLQLANQAETDVKMVQSQINDFSVQREMKETQVNNLLSDLYYVDKENKEMTAEIESL